jgi:hypothetical protein
MCLLHAYLSVQPQPNSPRYAAEYSKLYRPADAATLIPYVLESFIRSDRGYRRRRGRAGRRESARQSAPAAEETFVLPGREVGTESSA